MSNQGRIIGGFGVGLEEGAPIDDPLTIAATDAIEGRLPTSTNDKGLTVIDKPNPAPPIAHFEPMSREERQNRLQNGTSHGADCNV